jgi:hypothetical protein
VSEHLRHVVPAGRELVEDLLLRDELLLLEPVHLAAGQDEPRDLAPIDLRRDAAGVPLSHGS